MKPYAAVSYKEDIDDGSSTPGDIGEDYVTILSALLFTESIIWQTGYDFMNDNIELTDEMIGFLRDNSIEDERLIEGLGTARDKFKMAADTFGVAFES